MHAVFYDNPGAVTQNYKAIKNGQKLNTRVFLERPNGKTKCLVDTTLEGRFISEQKARYAAEKAAEKRRARLLKAFHKREAKRYSGPEPGFTPVQKLTAGIFIPGGNALRRNSGIRESFLISLSKASHAVVKKIALGASSKAARAACHVLAEQHGYCYLRFVRGAKYQALLQQVKVPDAKGHFIQRGMRKIKTPLQKKGLHLSYSHENRGNSIYHLKYNVDCYGRKQENNFSKEEFYDWFTDARIGSESPKSVKELCEFFEASTSPVVQQASVPNPNPTSIASFSRAGGNYTQHDLTGVAATGSFQQITRARVDIRFVEEKLEKMWPLLVALQSSGTSSGSSGSGSVVFPATSPFDNQVPGANHSLPLGNGGFPSTLEGQIARILFNLRLQAAIQGVQFQANLVTAVDVTFAPDLVQQTMVRNVALRFRYGSYTRQVSLQCPQHLYSEMKATLTTLLEGVISDVTSGARQDTLTTPGSGGAVQQTQRIDVRTDRIWRNIEILMNSSGVPVVQSQLTEAMEVLDLKDVDHVLSGPIQSKESNVSLQEQMTIRDNWTLENVLSRPTLVAETTWGSQERGKTLIALSFPNQWLSNLGKNTHFVNMLNMYTMMRANVVFELVVNTTSMYGGILAMSFDYHGRLHSHSPIVDGSNRVLDRFTMSNMDPVYMDISSETSVKLRVPFAAVSQYLSRQHAPFASQFMGLLNVMTFSTLVKSATAVDVGIKLYAYVENPSVAVLQHPDSRNFVVPQANIVKTVTSFSHSFVPGMRDAYPLALTEGYGVEREGSCRVEDIGGSYGLIAVGTWNTGDARNTEVLQTFVHPMTHNTRRVGPRTAIQATRLGHLARHYSYWNGTLDFKLQVACTAHHTGKLYIVFESGPDYQGTEDIETNSHILFDVNGSHEIEFSVPFSSPTPWKPTYLYQPFGDVAICRTGRIRIRSAESIKSALLETSSITVNLFMRAGRDFQLSVPRNGLQGANRLGETIAQVALTSLTPSLKMNSEDFNDLYLVLRRFSPLGMPVRTTTSQALVVPVRPIIPRNHIDNSVSLIAAGFNFWRGSLSYKIKILDVSINRGAFEIFHIPTMGLPEGIGSGFSKWVDSSLVSGRASTGSFMGSQTFHAEVDKEWEVTVPYYSMYEHLYLPLQHFEGGSDQKAKLPLLSTNNGCLVIRPLFGEGDTGNRAYSISVSMSCGQDFTLLQPSAWPLIVPEADGLLSTDVKVVAQASIETETQTYFFPSIEDMEEEIVSRMSGSFPSDSDSMSWPEVLTPLDSEEGEETGFFSYFTRISRSIVNIDKISAFMAQDVEGTPHVYFAKLLETVIGSLLQKAKLSFTGWMSKFVPEVDWRLMVSAMLASVILYKFRDDLSFASKVIVATLTTFVSQKVLGYLKSFIDSFTSDPQISAQVGAGLDLPLIIQLSCGAIAAFLGMGPLSAPSDFIKKVGHLGRSMAGVKVGVDALKLFSEFVMDNIVPSLGAEDSLTLKSLMTDSVEILEEVYKLNLEEMRIACFSQDTIKQRVLTCDGRLQELNKLVLLNACPPTIVNTLQRAMVRMDKLRTEVMAYKGEDGYRADPFHISVYGPPKIGKSAMMEQVSNDLIRFHGLPTTNKVYTRSCENVYWDNYMGQTTVMFDDLGQLAMSQPPSDLSELIPLKSNAPYMVHMADISKKGTYFTSKFIISSTNFKLYTDCAYVKSKDALHRRRDILVEMQPHVIDKETGLMPSSEFEKGLYGTDSYAKFRVLNSMNAEPETEWMCYDELIVLITARSEAHMAVQKALVERNMARTEASPAIQAILEKRESTIPVIVVKGQPIVVDAEAQATLDGCSSQKEKDYYIQRWVEHFKNAVFWRDFGALTSALPPLSQSAIAGAIRTGDNSQLNKVELVIYRVWKSSQILQKTSATALAEARERINLVGKYFNSLWEKMPKLQKKTLATALVSLGAVAVAIVLAQQWTKPKNESVSNVPMSVFEGKFPEGYQTKVRSSPKGVVCESGIDDYKTLHGKQRILVESGVDDFKTNRGQRKVIIESAADFENWSRYHPNLIPHRYLIDEAQSAKEGKLVLEENPLWGDFEEYCQEKGHIRRWTLPDEAPGKLYTPLAERAANFFSTVKNRVFKESGVDDFKTGRGSRKVLVEGDMNPMLRDVPEQLLELTPEELISQLTRLQSGDKEFEKVETQSSVYQMVKAEPQFTNDTQCVELIRNRLVDNVGYVLHKKSTFRMRCLIVDDKFMLLPKHFFLLSEANWAENDEFVIWVRGKLYTQSFNKKSLLCWPSRDLSLYLLSARVTGAKSVVKFIADKSTHASYRPTDGSLLSLSAEVNGNIYFDRHHLPVVSRMTRADHERVQYKIGKAVHIVSGYTYAADTVNGDCGSVLLQHNVRQPQKVLGLHVAGQERTIRAFAELLIQEEVLEKMQELSSQAQYIPSGSMLQSLELAHLHGVVAQGSVSPQFKHLNSNIDILGPLPNHMQKRVPDKTGIRPSPLQGFIDLEPKTEPAALSAKDSRCLSGIDPVIATVGGYGLDSKPFKQSSYDLIREHQIQKLRKYDGYIGRRLLKLEEAINGIEGVDYADAMNMHSAEGSFWNLSRPFWAHNKSWMFENLAPEGARAQYRIKHDSGLLQKVIHRLGEARQGRRVLSVTAECAKDERRPLKKTRPAPGATAEEIANFTPNTRSFSIMPIDYNILVRAYFWDFAAMIMKNRGELPPQVGIDPCSIEWTALMKRLLSTSSKGFAGDYKNYDRQTPAEFMDLSCDIINGWYNDGPVNAQIRKVLMGEAYDRMSIVKGALIHIDKGLPSGFPLTTIVNSLNNDTYKYCTWLEVAPVELRSLDKCDELVDSIYYGDDNAHAIDPLASSFFNMKTMGQFLEQHGVVLTDEQKNHWSEAEAVVGIEGISFLKRLFVKHAGSGLYLAPLEKRSIEDRLLWCTDSKFESPEELLAENITNSLRDAFHWGPAYFLELKNKISEGLERAYPDPYVRRQMLSSVTYGGEELRWLQTCKFIDGTDPTRLTHNVFGF